MTRNKDAFLGIYAAVLPYIIINVTSYFARTLSEYVSRTFDVRTAFIGNMAIAVFMGISLAVCASYYFSKPVEISKIPMIGLMIGLIYSTILALYWALLFFGIDLKFMWSILPRSGGETKVYMVLGFYSILTAVYLRTRTYIPKEKLKEDLDAEHNQDD